MQQEDVIIIGGGPCGVAAAIELKKIGVDSLIIEKGSLTESIRRYPLGMKFFSTAENIEVGGLPFPTSNVKPTREEAMQYYRKVVQYFGIRMQLYTQVDSLKKEGGQFQLTTSKGEQLIANKVIMATGYFDQARMLGIEGEEQPYVKAYYDEAFAYSFTKVVIIGGGNSAIEAALQLYRHNVDVTMVVRGSELKPTAKYWLVPDITNRIKEGKIKVHFNSEVKKIHNHLVTIRGENGEIGLLEADTIFKLVGYLPKVELLRQAGVSVDDKTLVPTFDDSTYETNVPGLFVCGTVLAGTRTESVFIENGREHARVIASRISNSVQ